MKKIRVNHSLLTSMAKQLKRHAKVKHTEALDALAKGLGFENYRIYKEHTPIKAYNHWLPSASINSGRTNIETLNIRELHALDKQIDAAVKDLYKLSGGLPLTGILSIPWAKDEQVKRLNVYLSDDSGYNLITYLGLYQYLLDASVYKYDKSYTFVHENISIEEVLKLYCESLMNRYYRSNEIIQSTVMKSYDFKKLPDYRVKMAEENHLIELIAFSKHPLSTTYCESLVIKFIAEDLRQGGDGSGLYEFLREEFHKAELRRPPKHSDTEGEPLLIEDYPIPKLVKRGKNKEQGNILSQMIGAKKSNHRTHELTEDGFEGICSRYPLVLNSGRHSKPISLSRGDLIGGICVRGTTGSGSYEATDILLSQLMSTGGGLVHIDNVGWVQSFHKFYSYAYALNRERDIVVITHDSADNFSESDLRGCIRENKLVYVLNQCMEKSPEGIHQPMVNLLTRLGRALNEKRENVHTPFTISANDGFHYDLDLFKAFIKLDKRAIKNRYGRIFCDYGECYNLVLREHHHYLYHILMHSEGEDLRCPYQKITRHYMPGECMITMDDEVICENDYVIYKTPKMVDAIVLNQ